MRPQEIALFSNNEVILHAGGVKKGQKLRAHYMNGPLTGLVLSITKVKRSILQKDKLAHSSREIQR